MTDNALRYRRSPDVLSRNVGADVLVTTPGSKEVQVVSDSAVAIWDLLEGPSTFPDLVVRLAALYGVPETSIESDVRTCVEDLLGLGVLEQVVGADA